MCSLSSNDEQSAAFWMQVPTTTCEISRVWVTVQAVLVVKRRKAHAGEYIRRREYYLRDIDRQLDDGGYLS